MASKNIRLVITGDVANPTPTSDKGRKRLGEWKSQVESEAMHMREENMWDPEDYDISIDFSLHPANHGGRTNLDLRKFAKPIVQSLAFGLFGTTGAKPKALHIHQSDDVDFPEDEGVVVCVSSSSLRGQ